MSNAKFLRMRQLATLPGQPGRLPVSPPTIWRWVKDGTFPQPVRLGAQVTAWPVEAVEAWEKSREGGTR